MHRKAKNPTEKPKAEPAVFKVAELATRLEVSEQHILNAIDEGRLAAINIGGHTRKFWRIPRESVDEFLRAQSSLNPGGAK